MGSVRWLLCILLTLALLHSATPGWRAHVLADGDLVEFEDDDMMEFEDDDPVGFHDGGYGGPAGDPPGQPVAMDMTPEQFVEAYNAACCEDVRVHGLVDRDGTVFGVTYLAVGDKPGLYAQLAVDPIAGKVLIAGAKLDACDGDPDLPGFADVAAAVMCVTFPDLSGERRESLLGQTIDLGEQPGQGGAQLGEGACVVHYVVHDDGERAILMYRTEA